MPVLYRYFQANLKHPIDQRALEPALHVVQQRQSLAHIVQRQAVSGLAGAGRARCW
jgi:hypothetical protein